MKDKKVFLGAIDELSKKNVIIFILQYFFNPLIIQFT